MKWRTNERTNNIFIYVLSSLLGPMLAFVSPGFRIGMMCGTAWSVSRMLTLMGLSFIRFVFFFFVFPSPFNSVSLRANWERIVRVRDKLSINQYWIYQVILGECVPSLRCGMLTTHGWLLGHHGMHSMEKFILFSVNDARIEAGTQPHCVFGSKQSNW